MVILFMTKVKKIIKKVWKPILITILVFITVSFAATKLIYDSIFPRYDPEEPVTVDATLLQQRQEITFQSGDASLQGYFYDAPAKEILVLLAPGYHAGADDYLEQIRSFLKLGWGVFAFDATGSCESEGDSSVGFPQEVHDLQAALGYLEEHQRLGYSHLVLFGHSRGGYAVCCALETDYQIDAVISVGGINSAMEGIMEPVVDAIGPVAYVNYPFLWAYQAMLFGTQTVNLDAARILSETEVPVLIIHGKNDETVSYDAYSIISYQGEIQSPNVEFFTSEVPGSDGHTDILYDEDGSANDVLMAEIEAFVLRSID